MKQNTEQEMKEIAEYRSRFEKKTQLNRQSKETFIKTLKEQKARINGFFDSLERISLQYMDKQFNDNTKYIRQANTEIANHEKVLRDLKQQLDTASSEKEVLIFISLKRGEKLLTDMKNQLSRLDATTNRDNFQLVIHPEIEHFVQNLPDLGYVEDEQTRQDSASDEYPRVLSIATPNKLKICCNCGRQVPILDRVCYHCSSKLNVSSTN